MIRRASVRLVAIAAVLLYLGSTGFIQAQSVLQLAGELAVTNIYRHTPYGLHLTETDMGFIWWGKANGEGYQRGHQWLTTRGMRLDRPMPSPDSVCQYLLISDTAWTGLCLTKNYIHYYQTEYVWDFKFCSGAGSVVQDTSEILTWVGRSIGPDDDHSRSETDYVIAQMCDTTYIFREVNDAHESQGLSRGFRAFTLQRWTRGSIPSSVVTGQSTIFNSQAWQLNRFHDLMRCADARDGKSVIYQRTGGGRPNPWEPDTIYNEALAYIDLRSGRILDSNWIGTTPPEQCSLTPYVLPHIGNTVDLLRNDSTNSMLVADRYRLDGTHLAHFILTDSIASWIGDWFEQTGFDYDVVVLDDDSRLIAWTMSTSGGESDCYVKLFDRDWNQLGGVKRIHLDTTGRQYGPTLAAHGDRFAVAWRSQTVSGRDSLYVGYFQRDQLLAAEPTQPAQVDLQVSRPWPLPARESFRLDVTIPQSEANVVLECHDLLGRIMFRRHGSTTTGLIQFHEDVSRTQPGVYLLTVRHGGQLVTRNLLVE
jgi:hypothetical protein